MKLKSLASALCLMALCAPLTAQSGGFTEADLEGVYAFSYERRAFSLGGSGRAHFGEGLLWLDGIGEVRGLRTINAGSVEGFGPSPLVDEQAILGTYSVDADGRGHMTWTIDDQAPFGFAATEELSFTIVSPSLFLLSGTVRSEAAERWHVIRAKATRRGQEAVDPSSVLERLEALSAEVADLTARLEAVDEKACESIRLLLTPQGLRETACCDAALSFPEGATAPTCGGAGPSPAPPANTAFTPVGNAPTRNLAPRR